ncbi:MAG: CTP synthase [Candidatus Ancillula sp.]|jgi:CTP synthase|nr:CTP synthase [Candidatus Ancillula sp.]
MSSKITDIFLRGASKGAVDSRGKTTNSASNPTKGGLRQTKHIFITGGVISGLGKGLTASSIGLLLKSYGYKVTMQKFDPYLNPDPGTMSPYEHGEVFVTEDGGETDLDLGNYERFINVSLPKLASATTGQVYQYVLNQERKGEYLGKTIQVIPHITDEIKWRMRAQEENNPDIIITEIGGTVGDIESQPFLESARQIRRELGSKNVFFVHCSLLPYIRVSGEMKTKPTQHSVMALRSVGIQPNALVLRSELPISEDVAEKVALMCDVENRGIVNCVDVPSIYDVPGMIHDSQVIDFMVETLGLDSIHPPTTNDTWKRWEKFLESVHNPKGEIEIALVGKYISLHDSYLSVTEALKAAGYANDLKINVRWVDASLCETANSAETVLDGVDGVLIPGGFGARGVDGKIGALHFARTKRVPLLGICLGLQCAVIEYARNVLGLEDASSTEFGDGTSNPVIATMAEQEAIVSGEGDMGGTMRLGSYDAKLKEGTIAKSLYGNEKVSERHRHRFEVNNRYVADLEASGLVISGTSLGRSKDGANLSGVDSDKNSKVMLSDQNAIGLVEFIELSKDTHPYYVATQAHPEFKSRPTQAHPLFLGLIEAAAAYKAKREGDGQS